MKVEDIVSNLATAKAPPPTVASKLVRGGRATGGLSGPQGKRSARSAMYVDIMSKAPHECFVRGSSHCVACCLQRTAFACWHSFNCVYTMRSYRTNVRRRRYIYPCVLTAPRRRRAHLKASTRRRQHQRVPYCRRALKPGAWNRKSAHGGLYRPTSLGTTRRRHLRHCGVPSCE